MRRFKDYSKFLAWQAGLAYLALWAVTFWTLDEGGTVFGKVGGCYTDSARVLFYWVCAAGSPLNFLAAISNLALTVTVWAPVYVAAATVQPDAVPLAAPIVAVHAVGLPLGLFVLIRLIATALDIKRLWPARMVCATAPSAVLAGGDAPAPPDDFLPSPAPPPLSTTSIKPRGSFGLRRQHRPSECADAGSRAQHLAQHP